MTSTNRVPFNALARGTSAERSELDAAIGRVLDRGWYALGPENAALEEELAAEVGTAHAVLVASGSDALQLAMQALGAEAGSLILTAANAGGYSSIAARQLHAVPVYADVDPVSLLLTPETLASACARMDAVPRIAVITHLYGAAADMTGIMDWAERTGVQIIEDCAQAQAQRAPHVGTFGGRLHLLSDQEPRGARRRRCVVAGDRVRREPCARCDRTAGAPSTIGVDGGMNSRMDELQAASCCAPPHLDAGNAAGVPSSAGTSTRRLVTRLRSPPGPGSTGHLAVVETDDRDGACPPRCGGRPPPTCTTRSPTTGNRLRSAGSRRPRCRSPRASERSCRCPSSPSWRQTRYPGWVRHLLPHELSRRCGRPAPPRRIRYSVVVPVYGNRRASTARRRAHGMSPRAGGPIEAVFVVDGSPDGSLAAAPGISLAGRSVAAHRPLAQLRLLRRHPHRGSRPAGDYIAVMAADLQEPAELMQEFFE